RKLGTRLDDLESALGSEAAFDPKTLSKSFNIGCNDYGEFTLVQPLGRRFAAMAPRVNLYCVEATGQVFERLRSGTLDVGIGVFSNIPPDINHRVLLRDEFVCAVRTGHPVLKRKWNLERYLELSHVLVSPGGTPEGVVDRILNAQGLSRRVARTVSNFLAAPLLVSESDYVLTVSKRILDSLGDRVKLATRAPPLTLEGYSVSVVWHRRFDRHQAIRWLIDSLTEVSSRSKGQPKARRSRSPR
ncbi:MAG: LysR substrate-binding domain-containing protein, partial [Myxococcota bacterium]